MLYETKPSIGDLWILYPSDPSVCFLRKQLPSFSPRTFEVLNFEYEFGYSQAGNVGNLEGNALVTSPEEWTE